MHIDPLFVGLTRPVTLFGIPYVAFVGEFIATAVIFLMVGNPLYLLLALPCHGVLYLIGSHDPGLFHSMAIWMKTKGRCRNTAFWGAASFSPLPTKK
ncbi:type IV secretion system protein VirB3, partial [Noviherbaspirillum sp.]|uniref:type IV secretion system protein VirB3 n=1 Tax=Noviherbaspirillum sp. TaxID=1926288 RepID=UPI002FE11380